MDEKYWKALAKLGIPGVALGVFYKLYDKFDWPLKTLPADLVFILALVSLFLIAAVVIVALMDRSKPEVKISSNAVSINIPKNCSFRAAANAIAGDRIVNFEGFSENELSIHLQSWQVTASSPENLITQLRQIASHNIRPYTVTLAATGGYIARVV